MSRFSFFICSFKFLLLLVLIFISQLDLLFRPFELTLAEKSSCKTALFLSIYSLLMDSCQNDSYQPILWQADRCELNREYSSQQ